MLKRILAVHLFVFLTQAQAFQHGEGEYQYLVPNKICNSNLKVVVIGEEHLSEQSKDYKERVLTYSSRKYRYFNEGLFSDTIRTDYDANNVFGVDNPMLLASHSSLVFVTTKYWYEEIRAYHIQVLRNLYNSNFGKYLWDEIAMKWSPESANPAALRELKSALALYIRNPNSNNQYHENGVHISLSHYSELFHDWMLYLDANLNRLFNRYYFNPMYGFNFVDQGEMSWWSPKRRMSLKFDTLVDLRDLHMANQTHRLICENPEDNRQVLLRVGKAHVEGIANYLQSLGHEVDTLDLEKDLISTGLLVFPH